MKETGERIPDAVLQQAAAVMRVLAHPQRIRICELLDQERFSVGQLADRLQTSQNVVSQHLAIMRAHGIVEPRRNGRSVHYRVVHPAAGWLLGCIRRHARRHPGYDVQGHP